jgi:polysaccharide chain length determinant protein (PEP-CTERM system associated)
MNMKFDLQPYEYWAIAVRRKWLILGVMVLCLSSAWGVSQVLPKSYRSNTLILVENQKIPEAYVSSTVAGTVSDRLTMINQYVMSRTILGEVADEFTLFPIDATELVKDALIQGLKKSIKVEIKGGAGRVEAFTISFAHSRPEIAQKVTARLASRFVEENLKVREQFVQGTTEFLQVELDRAKMSLQEQERAIGSYQQRYRGELPGQVEANLMTLNRLQGELQKVSESLQARVDRRAAIQKTINAYELMGIASVETPSDSLMNGIEGGNPRRTVIQIPGARADRGTIDSPLAKLKELESRLAALTVEYKDTYPDVIQTRREIAKLNELIAERAQVLPRDEKERDGSGQKQVVRSTDTMMDSYLYQLRRDLNESDIGIVRLQDNQARLAKQIADFEARVEHASDRQQELTVLQRDYENTKLSYQSLLQKQLGARISENLEKRQKGEAFRILDPANFPTVPESPDVMKIMLVGLVLGSGLGYGSAFLLGQKTLAFRRPEDAESFLGFPVLASIPDFRLAAKSNPAKRLGVSSIPKTQYGYKGDNSRLGITGSDTEAREKSELLSPPRQRHEKNGRLPQQEILNSSASFESSLVAKWMPVSAVAEQFRVAATRLILSSSTQKSSVVVVTSAVQGEGKTTTSANLAYVLANDLGKSTLVIDCDFKQPRLHCYLGVESQPGLAELISGDAPLADCLHKLDDSPLWVLPCGRRERQFVDLTKIPQIRTILSGLRERFEFIIIDAPPIFPLADMNLLASIADMLVLVIRAGITPQDMVSQAMKALKPDSRVGIIMTGYGSGYSHYQEYHRSGYGEYVK